MPRALNPWPLSPKDKEQNSSAGLGSAPQCPARPVPTRRRPSPVPLLCSFSVKRKGLPAGGLRSEQGKK